MSFVGREAELDLLRRAWQRSRGGETQAVVLVGESRLGKTRIVQEFFARLSTEEDPENYWPDALPAEADSLQLDPSFEAQAATSAACPFLWWAWRWTAPTTRNRAVSEDCAALAAAAGLRPHVGAAGRLLARREGAKSAALGAGKTLLNLATLGGTGTAVEILERFQDWWAVRKASRADEASLEERRARETRSRMDELRELLRVMCFSPAVVPAGVPLVLVLDDAQWADADSLRFLRELVDLAAQSANATRGVAPGLLIVATCWEREWNAAEAVAVEAGTGAGTDAEMRAGAHTHASVDGSAGETLAGLLHAAQRSGRLALQAVRLGRLADDSTARLVAAELPGLSPEQAQVLIERAGGSPGLLAEIILNLRRSRHLFEGGRTDGALTGAGLRRLRSMDVAYHTLVEERLAEMEDSADRDVAALLRLASYLGVRFAAPVLAELAQRLHARTPAPAVPDGAVDPMLQRAERPLALIQSLASQLREFSVPIYREVLRRQLEESEELGALVRKEVPALIADILEPDTLDRLEDTERDCFLAFAIEELQQRLADGEPQWRPLLMVSLMESLRGLVNSGRPEAQRALLDRWYELWMDEGDLSAEACSPRRLRAVVDCAVVCDRAGVALELFDGLDAAGLTEQIWLDGSAQHLRAYALLSWQDLAGAREAYAKLLAAAEAAVRDTPDDRRAWKELSSVANGLAVTVDQLGEFAAANEISMRALEAEREILRRWGPTLNGFISVIIGALNLANGFVDDRRHNEAAPFLEEARLALEECRETFGEDSEVLRLEGLYQDYLARVFHDAGDVETSLALQRRSIDGEERLLREYGESGERLETLATYLERLLFRRGKLQHAPDAAMLADCERAREVIDRAMALYGATDGRLYLAARCRESEIACRLRGGETPEDLAELVDEGLALARQCLNSGIVTRQRIHILLQMLNRRSLLAQRAGDIDEALPLARELLGWAERLDRDFPDEASAVTLAEAREVLATLET